MGQDPYEIFTRAHRVYIKGVRAGIAECLRTAPNIYLTIKIALFFQSSNPPSPHSQNHPRRPIDNSQNIYL